LETIASLSRISSSLDDPRTLADAARYLLAPADEAARRRVIARCLARFAPHTLCAYLKDESERALQRDARDAVALADALLAVAVQAERADLRGLGLMARGDALRFLGDFVGARDTLDAAGDTFLAAGDEVGWARTRIGWLVASHHLGQGPAALAALTEARAVLIRHEQWLRAAILENNAGWVCCALGRYEQARAQYDRARELFARLGDAADVQLAWVKANTATVLMMLGEFAEALRLHEEVRQTWVDRGDVVSVGRQEHNIAYAYAGQGRFTQALRRYNAAAPVLECAGLEIEVAWNLLNTAQCHLSLNHPATALELAEAAIERFERCGTPTEAAKARTLYALASARQGGSSRALELLDGAEATFASASLEGELALVLLQRAALLLEGGRVHNALAEAARARALCARCNLPIQHTQALLVWGRASLADGAPLAARAAARETLARAAEHGIGWLTHQAHHLSGQAAEAGGDLVGALAEYGHAIADIERMQRTLALELRSDFLRDKQQVYDDAILASLRLAQPDLAFAYLERAKSRALVDYLANNLDVQLRARVADRGLLAQLTHLREEHNWFYSRLYGHSSVAPGDLRSGDDDADRLRRLIHDRERRIAALVERLALDRAEEFDRDGAAHEVRLASSRPEPGTTLLEYHFRPDGGTVFVLDTTNLIAVELTARPDELRRLLQRWQINLAAAARAIADGTPLSGLASNARGILAALYRALLAPVAERIADGGRLVIVPYGVTHAVPFHALHDGVRHLIERYEVTVCPSSDLLRLCAERARATATARSTALVMANTADGRLPLVLEEARAVAALFPGELYLEGEASCATLVARAPRHRLIHLAAHGEARLDNPAFAYLHLADGQLGTVDVFNLDLRGALVTLSACETGRAVVTGGDELVGVSRGFLYAGAATLVQSLWRVEDVSTAALMIDFYRALRAGRPKGAALREAQLVALDNDGAHPYRWAPFQLVGDPGRL